MHQQIQSGKARYTHPKLRTDNPRFGFKRVITPKLKCPLGGAPCAVPTLCEKSAVFHQR